METKKEEKNVIKGQPGLVIIPLRPYTMTVVVEKYTLSVPMSGKFSELSPEFFNVASKTEDSDAFKSIDLYKGQDCIEVIKVIELLFATSSYPNLKDSQVFSIGSVLLDKENNMIHLTGSILDILD